MELNDNQLWYVRAAIHRGKAAIQGQINEGQAWLDGEGKDAPGTFISSVRGMIAYNKQMLDEMAQYIPEELQ